MLVTGKQFRTRMTLRGLEHKHEQFRISANATVQARIKSQDGLQAYTDWVPLVHNANKYDDWGLGVLDIIIPDTETVKVEPGDVQLEVNVAGEYVDKTGADTGDTYDRDWTYRINAVAGLP